LQSISGCNRAGSSEFFATPEKKDHPVSTSYQTFYDVHGVATAHKHESFFDFKVSDAGIRMLAHHFRDRFDSLDEALVEIQKESKKGNVDDAFVKGTCRVLRMYLVSFEVELC
jgi:hypothetical protein